MRNFMQGLIIGYFNQVFLVITVSIESLIFPEIDFFCMGNVLIDLNGDILHFFVLLSHILTKKLITCMVVKLLYVGLEDIKI